MHDSVVVQRPQGQPRELVLLFHGVGSSAADLVPLAQVAAQALPEAMVVSVNAPNKSTLGRGREWFSVVGVTEQSRPPRVEQAMPAFLAAIAHWQHESGLTPSRTTLIGFSQGAIMALEATQIAQAPLPMVRVVAIAGRFALPPRRAPASVAYHLIHGEADAVMPAQHSIQAAKQLAGMGASVTVDLVPGLGHSIDARVGALLRKRLTSAE
ncbi:MAG TPA: esterase [Ramlibacter sp.]|nr:esterase [Ramlibacter sp.]